jgi:hypothetical protein
MISAISLKQERLTHPPPMLGFASFPQRLRRFDFMVPPKPAARVRGLLGYLSKRLYEACIPMMKYAGQEHYLRSATKLLSRDKRQL